MPQSPSRVEPDAAGRDPAERDPAAEVAARLPVTDRRGWLMLLGVGLLVLAGVAWAALGRAPDTVGGRGIVVPAPGYTNVGTQLTGVVRELMVAAGEDVIAGEPLARLEDDTGAEQLLVAPSAGRVVTVLVRPGEATERGTPVLTMEPAEARQVAVGFLPAGPGKQVVAGMPALVGLESVPQSQYGTITGRVESVSPIPVPPSRVDLVVAGNTSLSTYFLQDGPVLEVVVALDEDPSTTSGYHWSLGSGPDAVVTTGTLAQVTVVLSEASPLQLIVR